MKTFALINLLMILLLLTTQVAVAGNCETLIFTGHPSCAPVAWEEEGEITGASAKMIEMIAQDLVWPLNRIGYEFKSPHLVFNTVFAAESSENHQSNYRFTFENIITFQLIKDTLEIIGTDSQNILSANKYAKLTFRHGS